MKKIYLIACLSFLVLSCIAQGNMANLNEMVNLNCYKKENSELLSLDKKWVVFIGNSITEGWVEQRPDFFTSNNYVGRGIGGQTSPLVLLRFRQDVINLKPVAVVINIGTNDIAENTGAYDADFTLGNIKSMAELAQANGIKVILSSVTPAAKYFWRETVENIVEKIAALNSKIKTYAKENDFGYVDYFSVLTDANGALPREYGRDGVHPNAKAYEIMEQQVQAVITKIIN